MLRLLLKDITVEKPSSPKQLLVHIRWQGAASTNLTVLLPLSIADRVRYPAALVDRVRELAHGFPDAEIANRLNREGHASAKGKPYTTQIVRWIRWRYQIPPVTLRRPEELTVQQVAQHFGVRTTVVYYWIERRLIQARQLNQMPYWITLMGQTNRNSKIGCATRLNYKKVKYPQTLLLKVHHESPSPSAKTASFPFGLLLSHSVKSLAGFISTRPRRWSISSGCPKMDSIIAAWSKPSKRIFGATIFFGTEEPSRPKAVSDWARFHFLDHLQLWSNTGSQCSHGAAELPENVVTLSEVFYHEIDRHRIPVEREVVSSLTHAPGVLDFYLWLAWKSWTVNGTPSRVPIVGSAALSDQLGVTEYSSPRRFRHLIVEWLAKVKAYWPECPAVVTRDRRFLMVPASRKSPAIRAIDPPGPLVKVSGTAFEFRRPRFGVFCTARFQFRSLACH